jgi:predicted ATPase
MKPLFDDYDEAPLVEKTKMIDSMSKRLEEKDVLVMKCALNYRDARNNLFNTSSTKLIIEEPEQNLFPSTQQMLVYYLMKSINNDLDHNLTLTTHSPYILYAINNCIMASLVFDKLSVSEKEKLNCLDSKIDPKLISIYEIKDGKINSIQQEDGLIGENFFDNQMREVMDEFYVMLNHY